MPLQSRSLFVERILHIELIYEPIFDASSAATLLRLARTCRTAHHAVAAYTLVAFDVDRLLSRFFPSPSSPLSTPPCSSACPTPPPHTHTEQHARARAFRSLQARTGTLVSGSCALQFFARTVYPESDLDLYVHMRHRREVGRWLLREGYTFVPTAFQDERFEVEVVHGMAQGAHGIYRMPGVAGILTFMRPAPREIRPPSAYVDVEEEEVEGEPQQQQQRMLKVQVIVAKNTPMEAILAFHSTCVMNVISYEKAYCLFPWATLEERRSLLSSSCRGRSTRRQAGLDKYARRGFALVSALAPEDIESDPASLATSSSSSSSSARFARYGSYDMSHARFLYGFTSALSSLSLQDGASTPSSPGTPYTTSSSTNTSISGSPPPLPKRKKPAFRLGWRWIDDSASWVLPLPLTGLTLPSPLPPPTLPASTPSPASTPAPAPAPDPVTVCNWEVRYPSAPGTQAGEGDGATMHFEVATGKVLRYRYLVTDELLLGFLGRELSARARAEEVKAAEELEEWTYYDAELPALCREFLHGLASRRLGSLRT
ncbi:hypothetical protein OH77DRAFT_1424945 [Trametes cingulata]|nr:hypothetical protein OH77DRAFT_1424945 [Trametes cingulata]